MSLETTLARIDELRQLLAPPRAVPQATATPSASFGQILSGATAQAAAAVAGPIAGGGTGSAMVAIARNELGQAESPPGSNDSPRIAEYRSAVPGGPVGPWCAYFVSWVARQAGAPLGESGQGFASVSQIWAWAQRAGRAMPNGPNVTPRPGDLIVWGDRHVGIVEAVLPDGRIQTIEGNSSDRVARRVHPPGSATGYVRMG
jgi:hypothetical protein